MIRKLLLSKADLERIIKEWAYKSFNEKTATNFVWNATISNNKDTICECTLEDAESSSRYMDSR